jgi:hypothetical protein
VVTSSEFRLAVECCRSCFRRPDAATLDKLAAAVDWPRFVRLARFHRVQGLVWHALGSSGQTLPADAAQHLSADAATIAAANLRSAVECRDLFSTFDEAGVPMLFVKGVSLGALAYRNISWKSAVDIDLLIATDMLPEAARLLRSRGYRLSEPKLQSRCGAGALEALHRVHKESTWIDPQRKLQIDLHTRLSDNARLIPAIGMNSTRCMVQVTPDIALPTLGLEELFAYLCVHGASSAWFRLKWITDLAALLDKFEPQRVEPLYRRSRELGAGRASAQALLLADALYGSLEDLSPLQQELNRDAASRWLVRAAFRQVAGRAEPVEPTARRFGTWRIHLSQLPLMSGWRFPVSELLRQVRAALF